MAVRGNVAKQNVINKIKEAFGADYVGEFDKKVYVFADDGGERVQIALSLTCPKSQIGVIEENKLSYNTGINFEDSNTIIQGKASSDISESEREKVRELMKKLNL